MHECSRHCCWVYASVGMQRRPGAEQRTHKGLVTALAYSADLGVLVSGGEDGTVRLRWTSSG